MDQSTDVLGEEVIGGLRRECYTIVVYHHDLVLELFKQLNI